ncbi:MAG: hypothetical protein ACLFPV_15620 [Spirochaetaceae bacterium]
MAREAVKESGSSSQSLPEIHPTAGAIRPPTAMPWAQVPGAAARTIGAARAGFGWWERQH